MKDYYKILGINKEATLEEIKSAYRKLAHKFHPDRPEGSAEKFKEINEAYSVLSNKEKREQYDRFGTAEPFSAGQGFSGWPGGVGGFNVDFGSFGDIEDIFDAFFGGGFGGERGKRKSYKRGSDLEYAAEITLEEAYFGAVKKIEFPSFLKCRVCGGKGYDEKKGVAECSVCAGKGEIRESKKTFFGNFAQVKKCPNCGGAGEVPNSPCKECKGQGRIKGKKEAEVEILPGISDGQIIKIAGAGEAGEKGTETGDLYVRIKIKKHQIFERKGDDLLINLKANALDILLEKKLKAKTISGGEVLIEIPEGFSLKSEVVVPGEGMPRFGSFGSGNLIVSLDVVMPKKISKKAKEILEKLKEEID